jgi:hypothetical protein
MMLFQDAGCPLDNQGQSPQEKYNGPKSHGASSMHKIFCVVGVMYSHLLMVQLVQTGQNATMRGDFTLYYWRRESNQCTMSTWFTIARGCGKVVMMRDNPSSIK